MRVLKGISVIRTVSVTPSWVASTSFLRTIFNAVFILRARGTAGGEGGSGGLPWAAARAER